MDGAYDTRRCHAAIIERQATAIIPIRKKRPTVERRLPSRNRPERNPARHTAQRQGVLEALDRIPCPKPDRGEYPVPQSLRRAHRSKESRQPDRRNVDPHHPHQPLQLPRHSRDHSRGLTTAGKGEVMPQASVVQQRQSKMVKAHSVDPSGPLAVILITRTGTDNDRVAVGSRLVPKAKSYDDCG